MEIGVQDQPAQGEQRDENQEEHHVQVYSSGD